jgi:hypothetical protein
MQILLLNGTPLVEGNEKKLMNVVEKLIKIKELPQTTRLEIVEKN